MANIAVVGCGLVGRAWAISFARGGHRVRLYDVKAEAAGAARDYVAAILPDLARNDLLEGALARDVLARLETARSLAEALEDADHVQENTPEVLEVKRAVFAELDAATPRSAVIASSTSALLPSRFTDHLAGQDRCLVVHPINPPYLIPAAEVVPAPWTSPVTIERTAALLRKAGHTPIVMKREIDGFVMNRLQGALLEEAFRLVADGVALAEDVDIGIREGLALRWSFMGPFETIDLNAPGGVRDYVERYQAIYERIFPSTRNRADWAGKALTKIEAERRALVPVSALPARQVWRDRQLMSLVAHKRRVKAEIGD